MKRKQVSDDGTFAVNRFGRPRGVSRKGPGLFYAYPYPLKINLGVFPSRGEAEEAIKAWWRERKA